MKFRTEISLRKPPFNLTPETPALLLGSCFAANIGAKMNEAWSAPVAINPCGVLYNPTSIGILVHFALMHRTQRRAILESSLTTREGRWVSWFMDSKTSGATEEECVEKAMENLDLLEKALEESEVMAVTFGTSWVWMLGHTDRAVGNCHKHPQSEFVRTRLQISHIYDLWQNLITLIRERNPKMKFIFTVSPVRYLSDGFDENSRLKAVLLLACEQLSKSLKSVDYFPAYEIINDDLRDYRFYADDLKHPSSQAIDYVWEKFCEYYLTKKDRDVVAENLKKAASLRHRPIISL